MSVTSLPAVTTPLEGTIVPVTWDSLGMGSLVAVSLVCTCTDWFIIQSNVHAIQGVKCAYAHIGIDLGSILAMAGSMPCIVL